jgi:hypothetical protein
VLERIKKYYDLDIEYTKSEIENIYVSGKLDLKEDIHEVLRLIALTANVEFETKTNKIVVTLKNK